jgi:hypothetical protein
VRGKQLRDARGVAHPAEAAVGRGVAGILAGVELGGSRSSERVEMALWCTRGGADACVRLLGAW